VLPLIRCPWNEIFKSTLFVRDNTIRFIPPLVVTVDQIIEALGVFQHGPEST
jgi:4-aminobutyrate aminotransferase-like enzyme